MNVAYYLKFVERGAVSRPPPVSTPVNAFLDACSRHARQEMKSQLHPVELAEDWQFPPFVHLKRQRVRAFEPGGGFSMNIPEAIFGVSCVLGACFYLWLMAK